jgi:hypothetical protein
MMKPEVLVIGIMVHGTVGRRRYEINIAGQNMFFGLEDFNEHLAGGMKKLPIIPHRL